MILKHTQNTIQPQKPFQAPDTTVQKRTKMDFSWNQTTKAQNIFNLSI